MTARVPATLYIQQASAVRGLKAALTVSGEEDEGLTGIRPADVVARSDHHLVVLVRPQTCANTTQHTQCAHTLL